MSLLRGFIRSTLICWQRCVSRESVDWFFSCCMLCILVVDIHSLNTFVSLLIAMIDAYCIAAAHLQLPHTLIDSLMISSAGVGGEGWKFINDIPSTEVCSFAAKPDHSIHPIPSVIHYCQRYSVDKYFYGKRKGEWSCSLPRAPFLTSPVVAFRMLIVYLFQCPAVLCYSPNEVPHEIFTCDFPLLVEPPMDIGSGKYLSVVPNGRPESERKEISAEKEKMDGFTLCALTKATNEAMIHFKDKHCEGGGGNREKTYDMWASKDIAEKK